MTSPNPDVLDLTKYGLTVPSVTALQSTSEAAIQQYVTSYLQSNPNLLPSISTTIQKMSQAGCSSCTVDAMDLQVKTALIAYLQSQNITASPLSGTQVLVSWR